MAALLSGAESRSVVKGAMTKSREVGAPPFARRLGDAAAARPWLALLLLSLVLFVPGVFALPPIDRDEAQYAQMTAQMIETNNFVQPKFQDSFGYLKPIGTFWLRAASVIAFGSVEEREIWPYRLPSLLGAVLTVFAVYLGGRAFFGTETALLGAALVGASLMLLGEASLAKTDAALMASLTAAQFALGYIYMRAGEGGPPRLFAAPGIAAVVFWVGLALGALFKGPIAPAVIGLTVAGLVIADRDFKWIGHLSPFWGLLIVVVLVAPWPVAVLMTSSGSEYFEVYGDELFRMIVQGDRTHGAPPGYYAALAMVIFWPGSLFLVPAAIWAWRNRSQRQVRFCLAWIVPAWLLFEIASNKLPYYLIPIYPALGLLCAKWAFEVAGGRRITNGSWLTPFVWAAIALWVIVSLALSIVPGALDEMFGEGLTFASAAVGVLTFSLSAAGARMLALGRPIFSAGLIIAAAAGLNLFIQQMLLPNLASFHLSPMLIEAIESHDAGPTQNVRFVGYSEPSLVFLFGTDTTATTAQAAASFVAGQPGRLAVVEARELGAFHRRISKLGVRIEKLETIGGFNYTRGRYLSFDLYRSAS